MAGAVYSIKKNRIERGCHPGFILEEDGTLRSVAEDGVHILYLPAIDGARPDSEWGRLSFEGEFSENMVCYLYAVAMNEDSFYRDGKPVKIQEFLCDGSETYTIKKEFLRRVNAKRFVNKQDVLLYDLKGRYLYLVLEVLGAGAAMIRNLRVDSQGDPFMNTFPEIYREPGGFFHRYLSVLSSVYEDFEQEIQGLPKLLDLDTCPFRFLPIYGRWLGIDVGNDFLEEELLRPLVKEAYALNRMKGTRYALKRVAQIVLKEDVLILEQNMLGDYIEQEQLKEFEKLYGSSIYDVTILLRRSISEVKKSQLLFLLNQFKPIRACLHIIILKQTGTLDDYSYLDMNAKIPKQEDGALDQTQALDGPIRLQ